VEANAAGFVGATAPVEIQPAGLNISGLNTSYSEGQTDTTVRVLSYSLNDSGAIQNLQPVMSPTVLSLTSSDPGVGTIQSSLSIPENENTSSNVSFIALMEGTTVVTASGMGFSPTSANNVSVTVTSPDIIQLNAFTGITAQDGETESRKRSANQVGAPVWTIDLTWDADPNAIFAIEISRDLNSWTNTAAEIQETELGIYRGRVELPFNPNEHFFRFRIMVK